MLLFVSVCRSFKAFEVIPDHRQNSQVIQYLASKPSDGKYNSLLCLSQDGNIPSGESFIRQFLVGQDFHRKEFGKVCQEVGIIKLTKKMNVQKNE